MGSFITGMGTACMMLGVPLDDGKMAMTGLLLLCAGLGVHFATKGRTDG